MDQADEGEFAQFVREHQAALFRTAYLLHGDYQRAEDAVQSAFAKTYLRWSRVRSMEHPRAYVRKILVNDATSWWRRRSSHERVSMDDAPMPVPVVDDDAPTHTATWQAILRLPPRQRAVIVLRYYEDLSEEQIAETLGCSRGTVKSQASAALTSLRRDAVHLSIGERP
jgi:RNA polymerase sigma-70 factor (sigma-E family)